MFGLCETLFLAAFLVIFFLVADNSTDSVGGLSPIFDVEVAGSAHSVVDDD